MQPETNEQPTAASRGTDEPSGCVGHRTSDEPELARVVGQLLPGVKCGARVLTVPDTTGAVYGPDGITSVQLAEIRHAAGSFFAPGKAVAAGGVAVSALEMSQNAIHVPWSRDEVERKRFEIMGAIQRRCVHEGRGSDGRVDYVRGANVAAFRRAADAMVAQGIV